MHWTYCLAGQQQGNGEDDIEPLFLSIIYVTSSTRSVRMLFLITWYVVVLGCIKSGNMMSAQLVDRCMVALFDWRINHENIYSFQF